MPLKFRSTGVAFSSDETSKDCTACSGGWTIGYIYYKAPEDRDEPLTWMWSIHGVPGKPPGMRGHGVSHHTVSVGVAHQTQVIEDGSDQWDTEVGGFACAVG